MSLEPCKVCGTLNAADAEICLSCGHPTDGKKRPTVFRIVAIALVICFTLPFFVGLINWILLQLKPDSTTPSQPKVSQIIDSKIISIATNKQLTTSETKSSSNRTNY